MSDGEDVWMNLEDERASYRPISRSSVTKSPTFSEALSWKAWKAQLPRRALSSDPQGQASRRSATGCSWHESRTGFSMEAHGRNAEDLELDSDGLLC